MDLSPIVVPVEVYPTVSLSLPILLHFIEFLEDSNKMVRMFLSDVLHPKIIHDQGENYWAGVMCPEIWGLVTLFVSMLLESFFEEVLCNNSCVRYAVHSFLDMDRYKTLGIDNIL